MSKYDCGQPHVFEGAELIRNVTKEGEWLSHNILIDLFYSITKIQGFYSRFYNGVEWEITYQNGCSIRNLSMDFKTTISNYEDMIEEKSDHQRFN